MKYIKGLDTLRAFAVIIVIINHWGPHKFSSALLTSIFTKIMPEGLFGVDLFFVLSGYLITRILLNARNVALPNTRRHIIKNFYIRRMLRIFPIYFLVVLTVAYVVNDQYIKNNIGYFATYASNFLTFKEKVWLNLSHTWSLGIEEQFYLLWPWIIIYSPKKYLFSIILFSIGLGIASSFALNYWLGPFFYVLLLPCITAFAIGALYAYVELNPRFKQAVIKIFLLLLPIAVILFFSYQFGYKNFLIRLVYSIIAINAIIYVTLENYNRAAGFILNNKFMIGVGKVSYGIYLYHYILPQYYYMLLHYLQHNITIGDRLLRILSNPPPAYFIHLTLLAIITMLSYRYVEVPFLNLKKYFTYVSRKKAQLQMA